MRKMFIVIAVLAVVAVAGGVFFMKNQPIPVAVGGDAPAFATKGALGGKPFDASLEGLLAKGPLVLYFFPKVFTEGCTLEAREFALKTPEFEAMGASILGMSGDDLAGLTKFSAEECRDAFPVAQATEQIMADYGVKLPGIAMTNRTSFVIAQNGRIAFMHSAMDYRDHVRLTLDAVKKLQTNAPTKG